jgi:tRNA (guanine37-N1)-methyltransferase
MAGAEHLVIACGRYEGIDARVAEHYRARGVRVSELSIGDYVLNGGEVAALVVVEAVARLLPGVVGNPESLVEESHGSAGLLEYPVYTRPPSWRGLDVPEVLVSGHHARIARWRRDRALERTALRRPDLLARLEPDELDAGDRAALDAAGAGDLPDGAAGPSEDA